MISVIIAGGSGTRLWPLSTPDYPKHLLRINGGEHSLLQYTFGRAQRLGDEVYVVSEASHAHHVREQLPELDDAHFVMEPARRGTANCILAALAHLKKQSIDPGVPIAILSADHYVRDNFGFMHSFSVAGRASADSGRIVLVGVEPDYPATGFGYIKKDKVYDESRLVYNVDSFKEKPDYKTAQAYEKSGDYLWNCGYFVGSLSTFERTMKDFAPELLQNYETLLSSKDEAFEAAYLNLSNASIDYALIEKTKDLLVVPAAFDWMDLGSFHDLHKAAHSDEHGNHITGEKVELDEVENSFIQNHEDKPVAVIGLDNVVVVNTPHGIIVARKDLSQKVGEISKKFNGKKIG